MIKSFNRSSNLYEGIKVQTCQGLDTMILCDFCCFQMPFPVSGNIQYTSPSGPKSNLNLATVPSFPDITNFSIRISIIHTNTRWQKIGLTTIS